MMQQIQIPAGGDRQGFTMIEVIIVILLAAIIATSASLLIGQTAQIYQKEDSYSSMTNQGRLALEEMGKEIRIIRSAADVTSACTIATSSSFTFTDSNGISVSYSYSGGTLSSGANILANNLSSFAFTYYDKTGTQINTASCSSLWTVTINLTESQGSDTLPMRVSIHPRSF